MKKIVYSVVIVMTTCALAGCGIAQNSVSISLQSASSSSLHSNTVNAVSNSLSKQMAHESTWTSDVLKQPHLLYPSPASSSTNTAKSKSSSESATPKPTSQPKLYSWSASWSVGNESGSKTFYAPTLAQAQAEARAWGQEQFDAHAKSATVTATYKGHTKTFTGYSFDQLEQEISSWEAEIDAGK